MVRPPITPSGIAGFELALSIFDNTDLDIGSKAQFIGAVYSTVIASALNTTTEERARSRAQMTEAEIFAALLEGTAAFFTAQQRAMAAATENADELVRTLTRVMNRARQDAITTEIMEIVGGAEALRQSKGA